MNRSLRRNLFLSSLLLLFIFTACSPLRGYKKQGQITVNETLVRPIINRSSSLLYKARIKLYNKTYSGLMILKETAPGVSHLTFITEVGMKVFDYEIRQNEFKLTYIFGPLDKTRTKAVLEKDMKLLLLYPLYANESVVYEKKESKIYFQKNDQRLYFIAGPDHNIDKVVVKSSLFKKQQQIYLYNDSLQAEKMTLKHFGFLRLKMEFNRLDKITP